MSPVYSRVPWVHLNHNNEQNLEHFYPSATDIHTLQAFKSAMPRSRRHHHDVYDDTNLGDQRHEMERHEHHRVPVTRREHHDSSRSRAVVDPFRDMGQEMRRFHEETQRSMGGWGFGSMFGAPHGRDAGFFSSFDRMFDDAFTSMSNVADNAPDGRGSYFYESRTRTVGPDGRVHEEHVRTTPDEHGHPRTKRSVRDAESEREMDPFWRGVRSPFGQEPYGMIDDGRRSDDVIVEELESSDEENPRVRHRDRSSRRHRDDADVQVIEEHDHRPQSRPGDWMKQRYDQWRNRA